MNYILAIETATNACSVGLFKNEQWVGGRETMLAKSHSEKLTIFIAETLAEANIQVKDLSALAVSYGPGSYTGLRIGLSAAKGLAYFADLPIILIYTPEMAAQACLPYLNEGDKVWAAVEAMRMEVYAQTFIFTEGKLLAQNLPENIIVHHETLLPLFEPTKQVWICGEGALKVKPLYPQNWVIQLTTMAHTVQFAGNLIFDRFQQKDFADLELCEPFYLKNFIPNRHLTTL